MEYNFTTIIFDLINAAIIFFCGYQYRNITLVKDIKKVTTELNQKLTETKSSEPQVVVKDIKTLSHEIHGGIHYFFLENSNTFVAQGQSLQDAAKHYTKLVGRDVLGCFLHSESKVKYCFVNDECMEYVDEQQ